MRTHTKLTALAAAFAALITLAPQRAAAASSTGTFTVQAIVAPTCTISGSALSFGNYDPNAGTPLAGQTTLSLTCTKNTGYSVALTSANGATFGMKNGADTLNYVLYSDLAHTSVWDGARPVAGTASSRASIALDVYGLVPINQDVPAGAGGLTYSDTVTATVTF